MPLISLSTVRQSDTDIMVPRGTVNDEAINHYGGANLSPLIVVLAMGLAAFFCSCFSAEQRRYAAVGQFLQQRYPQYGLQVLARQAIRERDKKPQFIPVCIDGRLMAALINAPRVTIEEID